MQGLHCIHGFGGQKMIKGKRTIQNKNASGTLAVDKIRNDTCTWVVSVVQHHSDQD